MLKKLSLPTLAALCLNVAVAQAQEPSAAEKTPAAEKKSEPAKAPARVAPRPRPKPTPTPIPAASVEAPVPQVVATPAPKKSFFQRIFGSRKKKPEATPAPVATPAPTPRRTPRKPVAGAPAKPAAATKSDSPVAAVATAPKPSSKSKPTSAPAAKTSPDAASEADADANERTRFEQAKLKAAEDPQVKNLKAKADNAATDEESRTALRNYNKALFEKIRRTDGSVSERATRLEAAILKRLSE